jgi:hypothetical protein
MLVFVGENSRNDYGVRLEAAIAQSGLQERIRITGWVDMQTYRKYLAAADVAVQLRGESRGESSRAILDCMSHGIPTIVNANGSVAELPSDGVVKLPDEFDDDELVASLEALWSNAASRQELGQRATEIIQTRHSPRACAEQYADYIERTYRIPSDGLIEAIAGIEPAPPLDSREWVSLAEVIAISIPATLASRQILLDISELVREDVKVRLQRFTPAALRELLGNPPQGYRVEPIYCVAEQRYCYARRFTTRFIGCPAEVILDDDLVEFRNGDLLVAVGLQSSTLEQRNFYQYLRSRGVKVKFIIFDSVSLRLPSIVPTEAAHLINDWFEATAECDGIISISRAVADDFSEWIRINCLQRNDSLIIEWSNLGADGADVGT